MAVPRSVAASCGYLLLSLAPAACFQLRSAPALACRLQLSSRSGDTVAAASDDQPNSSAITAFGSKFEDAFGALKPADRYNAVLDSLLSKGRGTNAEAGASAVELVTEMTSRRLPLSADSAKALLDATGRADNLPLFLSALSAARVNGACRAFGSAKLAPRPTGPSRSSPVPADSRAPEIAAALAFTVLLSSLVALQAVDLLDWLLPGETDAPPLLAVAVGLAACWAVDRYTQRGEYAATLSRGLVRLFDCGTRPPSRFSPRQPPIPGPHPGDPALPPPHKNLTIPPAAPARPSAAAT
eukprot:scaffold21942_cov101-Isochrysis_galbana.AAC.2